MEGPLQPEKERLGDDAEEAEIDQAVEIVVGAQPRGRELSAELRVLWAGKNTLCGRPCRLPTAAPSTSTFAVSLVSGFWGSRRTDMELRSVTIEAESGSSGMKTAAKYWSVGPAQWKGPGMVLPPLIAAHFDMNENMPQLKGRRSMFLLNW